MIIIQQVLYYNLRAVNLLLLMCNRQERQIGTIYYSLPTKLGPWKLGLLWDTLRLSADNHSKKLASFFVLPSVTTSAVSTPFWIYTALQPRKKVSSFFNSARNKALFTVSPLICSTNLVFSTSRGAVVNVKGMGRLDRYWCVRRLPCLYCLLWCCPIKLRVDDVDDDKHFVPAVDRDRRGDDDEYNDDIDGLTVTKAWLIRTVCKKVINTNTNTQHIMLWNEKR